jgi:hypothetical protein
MKSGLLFLLLFCSQAWAAYYPATQSSVTVTTATSAATISATNSAVLTGSNGTLQVNGLQVDTGTNGSVAYSGSSGALISGTGGVLSLIGAWPFQLGLSFTTGSPRLILTNTTAAPFTWIVSPGVSGSGVSLSDFATTSGSATISGSAIQSGSAVTSGSSIVSGSAAISGSSSLANFSTIAATATNSLQLGGTAASSFALVGAPATSLAAPATTSTYSGMTVGTSGSSASANFANTSGTSPTTFADTRLAQVFPNESVLVAASGTTNLLSVSGSGAGNVECIQLGIINADQACQYTSTLNILVDGTSTGTCDTQTFFCNAGTQGTQLNTWQTDNLGVNVSSSNSSAFAAYRRIYIPFGSSIQIVFTNGSAANSCNVFSQVNYRLGAVPVSAYPYSNRKLRFHMAVTGTQSLTQYSSLSLMSATATGLVDSITLLENSLSVTRPYWLEGNPTLTMDGSAYTYGGTEDFFGSNSYGTFIATPISTSWGTPINRLYSTGYATGEFRFFNKDPMIFNSTASVVFINGQSGESSAPGTITISALVLWYSTQ